MLDKNAEKNTFQLPPVPASAVHLLEHYVYSIETGVEPIPNTFRCVHLTALASKTTLRWKTMLPMGNPAVFWLEEIGKLPKTENGNLKASVGLE